jgi:phosphoglycolate phosphatase-like HAD superfamily hydrolase
VKLAIFDIDGTLLDNLESEDVCYAHALTEGLELRALDTDWRTYEHATDEGVAVEAYRRAHGKAPSSERMAHTVARFVTLLADAHRRTPLKPIAGTPDLLNALPDLGWTAALATGAWGNAARFKLAAAGLSIDRLPLATAEDGPARVAIVQAAWTRAVSGRPTFERVVLVGDAVWDVAAAQALGLPFVGRASGERAAELCARGATAVLADFTDPGEVIAAFETAVVPFASVLEQTGASRRHPNIPPNVDDER